MHEVVVRQDHALGVAGGTRGVEHDRGVRAPAARDLLGEEARARGREGAPRHGEALVARELGLGIAAQPARIVVPDVRELRALRHDLEELVGLLLVLDHRELDLGVLEDVDHLLGDRILVERHGNGAQGLRRGERPVETRPVRADDGDVRAAREPGTVQPGGERLDLVAHLAPGPALPDAERLLADGGMRSPLARVQQQKLRERVGRPAAFRHGSVYSDLDLV